ncbi:TlpA disulfide reductase family protein [Granulicella sp. S190]|uniref:TlpA disulfide reductase family protein n=1 Tax=Granulicella sp. S190 TaxID=1747226 RepID=UPI00131D1014|nr:TlpA disulfide reductase family protein [Granulicella sp. S190]
MRRSNLPALVLLCSFTALYAQTTDYKSNPKFQSSIAEGKKLVHERQIPFAIDAYKKASKIAQGKDIDTLNEIFSLQVKLGSYKDAVATATALEAASTTPELKARAEVNHGYALYLQAGDKHKPDLLNAADADLKAALALDPKNPTALYLDGEILAYLGKMDDARNQFKGCLSCMSPNDPSRLRTQHFAEDPALVLHKMAPSFEVTALDGSKFNLDAMGGRVVLIDFWATWCGPCNEELPHVKKIAKEFAGQPLVIISVSWDSDETKWKNFIAKNEMTWLQYRDADHYLSKQFAVESIPHYFTIDSDGVLTSEMLGSGSDVEGKLKKLLARVRSSSAPVIQTGN